MRVTRAMTEDNPFSANAERLLGAHAKRGERQAAKGPRRFSSMKHADAALTESGLERKLREGQRLTAVYRAARAAEWEEAVGLEIRLKILRAMLRQLGIDDADRIKELSTSQWIKDAPTPIKYLALREFMDRIATIRSTNGMTPFDDVLPGEDDDVATFCLRTIISGSKI